MIDLSLQDIADEGFTFLGTGSLFQTTAYDTSILISDDNAYAPFHHFELFDRKILWVNQVRQDLQGEQKEMMARAIFPCDSRSSDGAQVMNRLASLLCYATQSGYIFPRVSAGIAFPCSSVSQPIEKVLGLRVGPEQIDSAVAHLRPQKLSREKWIALAHYRQASIARSPYYEVLSYWKIIELRFSSDNVAMNQYINDLYKDRPDIFSNIPSFQGTASRKLRTIRHMSAHFALRGESIQDPDDPEYYNKASEAIFPLRRLSERLIEETSW